MLKQKISSRMCSTPQRVHLQNGQPFLAMYERVSRGNLPRNVTITRTRQIGPRSQRKQKQKEGSIFGNIAKLGAKVLTSAGILKKRTRCWRQSIKLRARKKAGRGKKHAPQLYRLGTFKNKNQNVKKAPESDVANYIVEEA